jgi:putative PIN family toxin of toxin-antitoxin system
MKIILDTNFFISYLVISKKREAIEFLFNLIFDGRIELIFSDELLSEIRATTTKKKLKKYFTETSSFEDFEKLLLLFEKYSRIIEVSSDIDLCRDKKDNFLLNLSKDSQADFLITGDKDLLIIKEIENTKIITWTDFKNLFSE